jgi:uncharacterized protein YcaQ
MDICQRIFELDYQLETYQPVARHQRVPRIADLARRPVGKLDARADRTAGLLRATRSTRTSPSARPPPPPPYASQIRDLARWLD